MKPTMVATPNAASKNNTSPSDPSSVNVTKKMVLSNPTNTPPNNAIPPISGIKGSSGLFLSFPTIPRAVAAGIKAVNNRYVAADDSTNEMSSTDSCETCMGVLSPTMRKENHPNGLNESNKVENVSIVTRLANRFLHAG